ncbi:MAG: ribonuclease III [Bacteroidetes bacterium]|nr:ribonuclease III [Bacteroidota bacterium]
MIKYLLSILSQKDKELRKEIFKVTTIRPTNIKLYKQAFRHSSASTPIQGTKIKNSNERLEYLGDAILNAAVAQVLFLKFPFKDEGFLTQLRSKIVSREQLNSIAKKIGITDLVDFNKKMGTNRDRLKSMPGNTLEAFLGALFLDKGYNATEKFISEGLLNVYLDIDALVHTETNYKSRIINWCQKSGKSITFETIDMLPGQHNQKQFKVQVVIDEKAYGTGLDYNKRKSEQEAAEKTCEMLGV